MSKQLTRSEKIKILQAMKEGKISPEGLRSPQIYVFTERSNEPGVYEHNGKGFEETEYLSFRDNILYREKKAIIWNERREYTNDET